MIAELPKHRPSSPRGREDMAQQSHRLMLELLKPIADRMLAIEDHIGFVTQRLDVEENRAEGHAVRLSDTGSWSQQMRSDIAPIKAHQVAMQNNLAQLSKDKSRLEQDSEHAKAGMKTMGDQIDQIQECEQGLHQSLESAVGRLEQLSADLRNQRSELEHHIKLTVQKQLESVTQRQEDCIAGLETTRIELQTTTHSLEDMKKLYFKNKKEDDKSIAHLNAEVARLQTSMIDAVHRTSRNAEELKQNSTVVKGVQSNMDNLVAGTASLREQTDSLSNQMMNLQVRFVPVEKSIGGLLHAAEAATKPVKTRIGDSKGEKGEGGAPVVQASGGRKSVAEYLAGIEDIVAKNNKRIEQMSSNGTEHEARIAEMVDCLTKQFKDMQSNANNTENDLKHMQNLQEDAIRRLDATMRLQNELKDDLDSNGRGIKDISDDLSGLSKQCMENKENIAKLGMNVGLCNEHFSGLRKGIKEATNRVVGPQDSLLPETTNMRAMTPTLPNMRGVKSPMPGMIGTPRSGRCHSAMSNTSTAMGAAWTTAQ